MLFLLLFYIQTHFFLFLSVCVGLEKSAEKGELRRVCEMESQGGVFNVEDLDLSELRLWLITERRKKSLFFLVKKKEKV